MLSQSGKGEGLPVWAARTIVGEKCSVRIYAGLEPGVVNFVFSGVA
jgi:hypothetical protein